MLIGFGDSYQLDCNVIDGIPSIKLVGKYFTINYSSSHNEERSYLNNGFLAYKFLNFDSDIVIDNHFKFENEDKSEVLVSFSLPINKTVYVYFNLITNSVGYHLEDN